MQLKIIYKIPINPLNEIKIKNILIKYTHEHATNYNIFCSKQLVEFLKNQVYNRFWRYEKYEKTKK